VFRKKLNFSYSAPTTTESALRLPSAPSVRIWQQTAICPVSLWTLVVELQPLNWARVQAVRRISDRVTMKELEEQRVCVCVCVFFNRFILNKLHYTVILHVLVYTLLHNDWFPFVLIWMVICLLSTYNICAIYTRNSLFSLLQFAEIYRFNKLCEGG